MPVPVIRKVNASDRGLIVWPLLAVERRPTIVSFVTSQASRGTVIVTVPRACVGSGST